MKESLDIFLLGLLMGAGVYTADIVFKFINAFIKAILEEKTKRRTKMNEEQRIFVAVLGNDDPAEFPGLFGRHCLPREKVLKIMREAAEPFIEPCGEIQDCFVPKMLEAVLDALLVRVSR